MLMKGIPSIALILCICIMPMWSLAIKNPNGENEGPCFCAIFDNKDAKEGAEPLISKHYMDVACNQNGTETCNELCTSLAKASRERATQALCQNIEHADNLIASLYTRTCNDKWKYAGMTAEDPICCHDKKITECKAATVKP